MRAVSLRQKREQRQQDRGYQKIADGWSFGKRWGIEGQAVQRRNFKLRAGLTTKEFV